MLKGVSVKFDDYKALKTLVENFKPKSGEDLSKLTRQPLKTPDKSISNCSSIYWYG